MFVLKFVSIFILCCQNSADNPCPQGKIERNIRETEKKFIVDLHNDLRKRALRGHITGQPKAKNMTLLIWDDKLASAAQNTTKKCIYTHEIVKDDRFHVGQNIFLEARTSLRRGSNWKMAIFGWFNEHWMYVFPKTTLETGHYVQMMWSTTKYLGCGYAMYKTNSSYPFHKFYICNYGPGGNIQGKPPYEPV